MAGNVADPADEYSIDSKTTVVRRPDSSIGIGDQNGIEKMESTGLPSVRRRFCVRLLTLAIVRPSRLSGPESLPLCLRPQGRGALLSDWGNAVLDLRVGMTGSPRGEEATVQGTDAINARRQVDVSGGAHDAPIFTSDREKTFRADSWSKRS
jgi:hypothetical protein